MKRLFLLFPQKPYAAAPGGGSERERKYPYFLRHKTVDRRASILYNHSCSVNGAVAQLARAFGSYPKCHRFESSQRYHGRARRARVLPILIWPVGQVVKTPPFHGGNMGSSPVRVTTENKSEPYLPSWRWVRILLYFQTISSRQSETEKTEKKMASRIYYEVSDAVLLHRLCCRRR